MNPKEALQILSQVSELFNMNGTDRDRSREAVKVLSNKIDETQILDQLTDIKSILEKIDGKT